MRSLLVIATVGLLGCAPLASRSVARAPQVTYVRPVRTVDDLSRIGTSWHGKYHIICNHLVHLPEHYSTEPPFPPKSAGWKVCDIRKYSEDGGACYPVRRMDYVTGNTFNLK